MIKRFLLILALILLPVWAHATNYYVNCNAAAGGNGTTTALSGATGAWDAIADVNGASFSAGDNIYFAKGCTWSNGVLVPPSSGESGNVITIGAYGTGANPIINAAVRNPSWTTEAVTAGENFTDATGDKPQAWYYFENGVTDGSGNSNTLTANGSPTYLTSGVKQGTSYIKLNDANSDYLSITDANLSANYPLKGGAGTTDFTIGFWFSPWETVAGTKAYYSFGGGVGGFMIRSAVDESGKVEVKYYENGVGWESFMSDAAAATNGTWYHVVVRWQGSTDDEVSMFINGVKQAATTSLTALSCTTTEWWWGRNSAGTGYSSIYLDEAFAFNVALTDEQIAAIYTNGLSGGTGYNLYYAAITDAATKAVWIGNNASKLTEVATKAELSDAGKFWYDDPNDRTYVRLADDSNPASSTVDVGRSYYGLKFDGVSYVTVEDLDIQHNNSTTSGNIQFMTGKTNEHITLNRVSSSYSAGNGVVVQGTVSDIIFDDCDVHHNGTGSGTSYGAGFEMSPTAGATEAGPFIIRNTNIYNNSPREGINGYLMDYLYVYNNSIYNNGDAAYTLMGGGINFGPGNTLKHGKAYNNLIYNQKGGGENGAGIHCDPDSGNVDIYYNVVYGNDGPGISCYNCDDTNIYNNAVYGNCQNSSAGLTAKGEIRLLEGEAKTVTNVNIKNNIAQATVADTYAIYLGSGVEDNAGIAITNNIWYAAATNWWLYGADGAGSSLATWNGKAKVGTDINSDPLFTSAATSNFKLRAGSPAINAGTDVSLTTDYAGFTVPYPPGGAPDIGAYEHRGGHRPTAATDPFRTPYNWLEWYDER